jgi:hypothetical protein
MPQYARQGLFVSRHRQILAKSFDGFLDGAVATGSLYFIISGALDPQETRGL